MILQLIDMSLRYSHNALVMFTFLICSSITLSKFYTMFVHSLLPVMSVETAAFFIFIPLVWLFLDNIVLGMDLFDCRSREKLADQKLHEITDDLVNFERKADQNASKWLSVTSHYQESLTMAFSLLMATQTQNENDYSSSSGAFRIVSSDQHNDENNTSDEIIIDKKQILLLLQFLKRESTILQKQNDILRKYLQQENEDHMETATY